MRTSFAIASNAYSSVNKVLFCSTVDVSRYRLMVEELILLLNEKKKKILLEIEEFLKEF